MHTKGWPTGVGKYDTWIMTKHFMQLRCFRSHSYVSDFQIHYTCLCILLRRVIWLSAWLHSHKPGRVIAMEGIDGDWCLCCDLCINIWSFVKLTTSLNWPYWPGPYLDLSRCPLLHKFSTSIDISRNKHWTGCDLLGSRSLDKRAIFIKKKLCTIYWPIAANLFYLLRLVG